jgi:hypothetical protein
MTLTIAEAINERLTHSLHTSEAKSFRGCRRRWSWIFREFYYPKTTAKPLEFGVAYHKAMETYYDPTTWQRDPASRGPAALAAISTFRRTVDLQRKAYTKLAEQEGLDLDEAFADYDERVELGISMLKYHLLELSPELDKGLTPKAVEIGFEAPISYPGTTRTIFCKCDVCWRRYSQWCKKARIDQPLWHDWEGLPVTYGGRIDCLMVDDDGRLWVFDWKTAARLQPDMEFLQLDDQIARYCWAMWKLGYDVAGFVYHEQKKAVAAEPEPNKTKRLGRWYSVSKSLDVVPDVYVKTVSENDPIAYSQGLYDEYIAWLRESGGRFHNRERVTKTVNEFLNLERDMAEEALEMIDQNLALYPSPGRFSCGNCAFREPCIAKNRGEDYQHALDTMYDRRGRHYWETDQPSTDKTFRG